MGRIRKFAVEMTRRVNRGESQTGPSPALGNPHQTRVPTFPQRRRRRAAWQRQGPTPRKIAATYRFLNRTEILVDTQWTDRGGDRKNLKNLLDRLTQMSEGSQGGVREAPVSRVRRSTLIDLSPWRA